MFFSKSALCLLSALAVIVLSADAAILGGDVDREESNNNNDVAATGFSETFSLRQNNRHLAGMDPMLTSYAVGDEPYVSSGKKSGKGSSGKKGSYVDDDDDDCYGKKGGKGGKGGEGGKKGSYDSYDECSDDEEPHPAPYPAPYPAPTPVICPIDPEDNVCEPGCGQ
jgi:hypothetical protein